MPSDFYLVTQQPRNHLLVQAINRFLDDRDELALTTFFEVRSPGEQVMMIGYLIKGEMPGMARELARMADLSLVTAFSILDRDNGIELAKALGWEERYVDRGS